MFLARDLSVLVRHASDGDTALQVDYWNYEGCAEAHWRRNFES
jgi:hypothetical protein